MHSYNNLPQKVWDILISANKMSFIPLIVDVGARNGMFILDSRYCEISKLLGFEPNKVEFKKLINNKTDTKSAGLNEPNFLQKEYLNLCLWEKNTSKRFYVTEGPGASTLMGKTDKKMTDFFLSGKTKNYETEHTKIKKNYIVKCKKLDDLCKEQIIDFLKIDTEGSELSILKGSERKLKTRQILFIKTEFVFFRYYKKHNIFGEIHNYLEKFGYRLIHIDLDQPKYSPIKTVIPSINDKGLMYAGDAYFCVDYTRFKFDKDIYKRLTLISFALGFTNLGLFFQEKSKDLSNDQMKIINKMLSKKSFLRKAVDSWKLFPSKIINLLGVIRS